MLKPVILSYYFFPRGAAVLSKLHPYKWLLSRAAFALRPGPKSLTRDFNRMSSQVRVSGTRRSTAMSTRGVPRGTIRTLPPSLPPSVRPPAALLCCRNKPSPAGLQNQPRSSVYVCFLSRHCGVGQALSASTLSRSCSP